MVAIVSFIVYFTLIFNLISRSLDGSQEEILMNFSGHGIQLTNLINLLLQLLYLALVW